MKEAGTIEPTRSARWQEAKVFAEVNAREMASPKPNIVEELYVWFKGVNLYHQGDMCGAQTEQDGQMQKHILTSLISTGEWLSDEIRHHDTTANVGVAPADVEATLESLYDSLRVSFGGMTEARRSQVVNEVFGASSGAHRGNSSCVV